MIKADTPSRVEIILQVFSLIHVERRRCSLHARIGNTPVSEVEWERVDDLEVSQRHQVADFDPPRRPVLSSDRHDTFCDVVPQWKSHSAGR